MTAKFCDQCGHKFKSTASHCSECGKKIGLGSSESPSEKSAVAALLLCMFLGPLGIHRFYVGKIGTGILMLLTGGGLGIWALVDLIIIATCQFRDKQNHPLIFTQGKTSGVKLALKVVGCVFAAIIIYIILLVTLVLYATSGITDTVRDQLAAMKSGDINKAYYSYTSKAFQKDTSLDTFTKFVNHYSALKNNKTASFDNREISDGSGVLKGKIKSSDGTVTLIEYHLIKEENAWKIIQIQVIDSAPGIEVDQHPVSDKNPVSNQSTGIQTYTDSDLNFTIKYSADWQYEKPKAGTIMFSGKQGTPSYYSAIIIQVLNAKKSGGSYENTKEAIEDLKKQILSQAPDAKIQDGGQIELPMNPGQFKGDAFIATYTYKGVPMKKLQFIVTKSNGKYIYAYGYTAPEKLYNNDLPTAKKMYETWDIK